MIEPPIPALHAPFGGTAGYPRARLRAEFDAGVSTAEAVYALAYMARALRFPVVASLNGVDVVAYPHQSAEAVAHDWCMARRARPGVVAELVQRERA